MSRKPRNLILLGSDHHRAGLKIEAGKENPAAERGRRLEAGVTEDIFCRFPLGFRGRKSRQEGKGEEETSLAQGQREGSGAVSCESEMNEAFLLTLFLYL